MFSGFKGAAVAFGACVVAASILLGITQHQLPAVSSGPGLAASVLRSAQGASRAVLGLIGSQHGPTTLAAAKRSVSCGPSVATGYQQCHFTDEFGQTLDFFLHIPPYDPHQRHPLVLVLQGGGERATQGMTPAQCERLLANAPYVKVWVSNSSGRGALNVQTRWPSYVVVPELTGQNRWVDVPPGRGSFRLASRPTRQLNMAKEIVDLLQQKYTDVDADRLYVTGVSLGGYGTWDAIERWPGYFAAAVPVSGAGDPTKAVELKRFPIWVFHGGKDRIVPTSGSLDMIDAIRAAGGDPRFTEFSGAGHDIWARVFAADGNGPGPVSSAIQWLFSQRKSSAVGPAGKSAPNG
jgi:predicted peptidase